MRRIRSILGEPELEWFDLEKFVAGVLFFGEKGRRQGIGRVAQLGHCCPGLASGMCNFGENPPKRLTDGRVA